MLALVAGEGELPGFVIDALEDAGRAFRYCEVEGHPSPHRRDRPATYFRLETLGSFIAELAESGVTEVCFAGGVARPPVDPSKIDAATMPLVPRVMAALQQGDDAAMRTLLSFFEEAGIASVGAHELRPDLLPAPGILGKHSPSADHEKDAARGAEVIGAMAQADVGQSCIVAEGQALAIEAYPGTDWMMQSLMVENHGLTPDSLASVLGYGGSLKRARFFPRGGVLVKAAKPGQELRIDMPTIGPDTLRRAAQVGLEGVVIEAGRVMVLDAPLCVRIADKQGLFIWVRA